MPYVEGFISKEKKDNFSLFDQSNDIDWVEDVIEYSDSLNSSSSTESAFEMTLDFSEENSSTINEKSHPPLPSSIAVEDTAQLKNSINQAFLDKLPQLMEYKQKGYNVLGLDKGGMDKLEGVLQEMRTLQSVPDALKEVMQSTINAAECFLDALKPALQKSVTPSSKLQEALQQANVVIRHICAALESLRAAVKVNGISWEAEVDRVVREQSAELVAAAGEKLLQDAHLPVSDNEVLLRNNELFRLLLSESTALEAENARFTQLKNSLLAENRITRQQFADHLATQSAAIVTGARDAKEYAMTNLHQRVKPEKLGNAVLRGYGVRDLSLYTRHIVAVDGEMEGNISQDNPLMGAFIQEAPDELAHIRIARAILPVAEVLGTVSVTLEKVRESVKPVAEERIKPYQDWEQKLWANMRKEGGKVKMFVPYLFKQGRNKLSAIRNIATESIAATLPGGAMPSDAKSIVMETALLLLDEIQQIEARVKQLPLRAWEMQEAVEQCSRLSERKPYRETSPVLSALLDERLEHETARWQAIRQTAQARLHELLAPLARFADRERAEAFQVMLSKTLHEAASQQKLSHNNDTEYLVRFNEKTKQTINKLTSIACALGDAGELAKQGHSSRDKLYTKAMQAIMALNEAKGSVKAAVAATGTALHNFSRGGMLARGMAEWAESLKQRYLREVRPEDKIAAAKVFELTLIEVVKENRTHFSKASDPEATGFLNRFTLALQHAAEHHIVYPPTAEEILAGSRSLPEDIRHWAEKKVVQGAFSAVASGGFRLITGAFSLPMRVAIRGAKTGRTLYRGSRAIEQSVRLGQGPATQVKNKLVKQELHKAAFRLSLSFSPLTAWGVAASIVCERLYNEKESPKKIIKKTVIELPENILWAGGYTGINAAIKAHTEQAINRAIQEMLVEDKKVSASLHHDVTIEKEAQTDTQFEGEIEIHEEIASPLAQADATQPVLLQSDTTGATLQDHIDLSAFSDNSEQEVNPPRSRSKRSLGEDSSAPLLMNNDSELSPSPEGFVSEESVLTASELTHKKKDQDTRLISNLFPSMQELASEAIRNKIYQKTGKQVDPNTLRLIRFESNMSRDGHLYQYDPIAADSHTLTEWVIYNFSQKIRDNAGIDSSLWGIYPTSHEGNKYDSNMAFRLNVEDFVEMVNELDFYKKIYIPKLNEYWNNPRNVKLEELNNIKKVGVTIQDTTLSEVGKSILLNGIGLRNDKEYSVSASLFDINGYRATDMLVFSDKKSHKVVLYMPREGKTREFTSVHDMRHWVVYDACKDPAEKAAISKHFSFEMKRDGVFYSGVNSWLDYLASADNAYIYVNNVYSDPQAITEPVIEYITQKQREEMTSNADNLIKSDSEISRDAWIEYLSVASEVLANPVTPVISLGLATEKAFDADNNNELAQAEGQMISDGINIGLMILTGVAEGVLALPEDEIAASTFNTTDFVKTKASERADIELSAGPAYSVSELEISPPVGNENGIVPENYVDAGNDAMTFFNMLQDARRDESVGESWQYSFDQKGHSISLSKLKKYFFKKSLEKERIHSYSKEQGGFINDDAFSVERVERVDVNDNSHVHTDHMEIHLQDMSDKVRVLQDEIMRYEGADRDDIINNLSVLETCIDKVNNSVRQINDRCILVHALVKKQARNKPVKIFGAVDMLWDMEESNKIAVGSIYSHPYVIVNKYPGFRAHLLRAGIVSEEEMAEYDIKNVAKYLGYQSIKSGIKLYQYYNNEINEITFNTLNPITDYLGKKYKNLFNFFKKKSPGNNSQEQMELGQGNSEQWFYPPRDPDPIILEVIKSTPVRKEFRSVEPITVLSEEDVQKQIDSILTKVNGTIVAENLADGIASTDEGVRDFAKEARAAADKAYEKYQRAHNLFNLAEQKPKIKNKLLAFLKKAAGLEDHYPYVHKVSDSEILDMAYKRMEKVVHSGYEYISSQREKGYDAINLVKENSATSGEDYAFALPYDAKKRILLLMRPKGHTSSNLSNDIVHESTHISVSSDDLSYLGNIRKDIDKFPSWLDDRTRNPEYFFSNNRISNLTTNYVLNLPRDTLSTEANQARASIMLSVNKLIKADALLHTAEYQAYLIDILDNTTLNADSTEFEFTNEESESPSAGSSRAKRSVSPDKTDLEKIITLSVVLMGPSEAMTTDILGKA